jgi:aminopeptidase N
VVEKLFEQIHPNQYGIEITVDLDTFTYDLNETINFDLEKPSNTLTFHAFNLEIEKIEVDGIVPVSTSFDIKKQTVSFVFSEDVSLGNHSLRAIAHGTIQDSLHGFYRSRYERDGSTHYMATTQFEAIHAREAIICIDEPVAKALFDVTLIVPKDLAALSNGEIISESVSGDIKTVKFETTPKMSTYLLAFIVGEFESVAGKDSQGTNIRVFATPGQASQLDFALDIAIKSLDYYADYFGLAYPLSKLDMVAIPDFASGAMENWGLVTYRETDLLIDPTRSSLSNRQRVTEVVAHELAHQWFGNLVTMEWWNDLWLNESFASWVETKASDHFFPEWKYWSVFTSSLSAYALDLDALANSFRPCCFG